MLLGVLGFQYYILYNLNRITSYYASNFNVTLNEGKRIVVPNYNTIVVAGAFVFALNLRIMRRYVDEKKTSTFKHTA